MVPSPLEMAEREQTGACVQRCLDFLSDSYRGVILLHEAHSLTAAEIADLLGESVGTIKVRLHRARRKLHEIMQIGCAVSQSKDGVPCCEPKPPEEIRPDEVRELLKKQRLPTRPIRAHGLTRADGVPSRVSVSHMVGYPYPSTDVDHPTSRWP